MSTGFRFRAVSGSFIAELASKIGRNESIVVIGPRYAGKRLVLARLATLVSKSLPVVRLSFLKYHFTSTSETVVHSVYDSCSIEAKRLGVKWAPITPFENPHESLLAPLDSLYEAVGQPTVILAANIDALPFYLARNFLRAVQKRVNLGTVIAVLTAEHEFEQLVYGPNSAFACADNYCAQYLDQDLFTAIYSKYLASVSRKSAYSPENAKQLWVRTGGNLYLLRLVLWSIDEPEFVNALVGEGNERIPITVNSNVRELDVSPDFGQDPFRYAGSLIQKEINNLHDLRGLLRGGSLEVGSGVVTPTALELAGVAIRLGNRLRFSCPLMEEYVKQRFTDDEFRDMSAILGDWEMALGGEKDELALPRPTSLMEYGRIDLLCTRALDQMKVVIISNVSPTESAIAEILTFVGRFIVCLLRFSGFSAMLIDHTTATHEEIVKIGDCSIPLDLQSVEDTAELHLTSLDAKTKKLRLFSPLVRRKSKLLLMQVVIPKYQELSSMVEDQLARFLSNVQVLLDYLGQTIDATNERERARLHFRNELRQLALESADDAAHQLGNLIFPIAAHRHALEKIVDGTMTLERFWKEEDPRDFAGEIHQVLVRASQVIRLTGKRLSAEPIVLQKTEVESLDICEVIAEVSKFDPGISKCVSIDRPAKGRILGSRVYLWHLFQELIQNSRKNKPHGEVLKIAFSTEIDSTGKFLEVICRDNGPGVPSDLKETIFERHFSRQNAESFGRGIGLDFVRRVMRAHQGSILEKGVASPDIEHGAAFHLTFPIIASREGLLT